MKNSNKICIVLIFLSNISHGQHYTDWTGFEFVKHYHPVLGNFVFNELMSDYTISLPEYFTDAQKLPEDCVGEADIYYSWARSLPPCDWDFISIEKGGILTIKKGYRWDGATNGAPDKDYHHRSSLVHDALYDLMRMRYLEPDIFDKGDPSETDNAGDFNRKMTDMIYFMIAVEDGESLDKAEIDFSLIRKAGWIGTSTDFQLKDWKFHVSKLRAYSGDHKIMLEWQKRDVSRKDPDPSICSGYTILRNGMVYDSVDTTQTTYIDNNVVNGEIYTYQLMSEGNRKDQYNWSNVEYAMPCKGAGNALLLDGMDDYFYSNTVCNDLCYNSQSDPITDLFEYSLEAWVLPKEKTGKNAILAFNTLGGSEHIALFYDGDNHKFCYHDSDVGYIVSDRYFSSDQWYRVALTFDSLQYAILYVNGAEEAVFKTTQRPSHGDIFTIGQSWNGKSTSRFFKGSIDEVRIWKKERSQTEIIRDMNIPLTGNESDLTGLWNFDEPSSVYTLSYWGNVPIENTIKSFDASAYGNDGIIKGYEANPVTIKNTYQSDQSIQLRNYPNPFGYSTTIKFYLSGQDKIFLAVYNVDGKEIEVLKNDIAQVGENQISWYPRNLPGGIYLCRLVTSTYSSVIKISLRR